MSVDDDPDAPDLLRKRSKIREVTSFSSAEEALAELKRTKPTRLICGIGMPKTDGYQLIRTLRAEELRERSHSLIGSHRFCKSRRQEALLAGYQALLAKPCDVVELVRIIADLL